MFNVNARSVHTPNVVVGMAIFTGGLLQFMAGMWAFPKGDVFGATGNYSISHEVQNDYISGTKLIRYSQHSHHTAASGCPTQQFSSPPPESKLHTRTNRNSAMQSAFTSSPGWWSLFYSCRSSITHVKTILTSHYFPYNKLAYQSFVVICPLLFCWPFWHWHLLCWPQGHLPQWQSM